MALFGKLRVMMIHGFEDRAKIPENIWYDCPIKESDKPIIEEAYDVTYDNVYHYYEDYDTKDMLDYLFDEYS